MLWRDVRKLITSLMRMLMYFSPVIWECHFGAGVPHNELLNTIMKLNPVYYIVNGYRESIFYCRTFLGSSITDNILLGNRIIICNWMFIDVQI